MQENTLSIDTGYDSDGDDAIDDGLAIPAFRRDLEEAAPQLVNKFESIIRNKIHQLEECARKYNDAKADLIKRQATAVSDDSHQRVGSTTDGSSGNDSSTGGSSVSSTPSQQPQSTTQAKVRVPMSISSTDSDTATHTTLPSSEAFLSMQVGIRLVPVIKVLTVPVLTKSARAHARRLAHAALDHANSNQTSLPVAARCSYYIALATYDPTDPKTTQDAVNWFQRATEATEAGWNEGRWAQEWLNRYESMSMESRPSSSSSWISSISKSVWNMVSRSKGEPESSNSSPALKPRPAGPGKERTYGRIPSFSTMRTGESTTADFVEEASPTSPDSGTSSGTQDHDGLKWSPGHLYGKGEILHGRKFELFVSPEPIYEAEHEEEQPIQADIKPLSPGPVNPMPRMQRKHDNRGPGWNTILASLEYYLPPASPAVRKYRITNMTGSPPSSSNSSSTSPTATTNNNNPALSYTFTPPTLYPHKESPQATTGTTTTTAPNKRHPSRSQSISLNNTPPPFSPTTATAPSNPPPGLQPSTHNPAQSEDAAGTDNLLLPNASRNKKRLSISHAILRATTDLERTRDEAARMEEGESPVFGPGREEREGENGGGGGGVVGLGISGLDV